MTTSKTEEPTREKTWVDLAMPFAEKLAVAVPGLVAGKLTSNTGAPSNDERALPELTDEDAALVDKPNWELRDFTDFGYAKRKADPKPNHGAAKSGANRDVLKARLMQDPQLMQKMFVIKVQLTDDEVSVLLTAIAKAPEAEQVGLLDRLKTMTDDDAVATCRQMVSVLRDATEGK